jgi:hypothetical protein
MPQDDISPERFADAYLSFVEAVSRSASPPGPLLVDRIRAHLGSDIASLQAMTERFDAFDHPNLQVALDDYLATVDPAAAVVGIAGEQKQYVASVLSEILGQGEARGPMMRGFVEGPVDFVNFHLARGRVLPCIQHGIYLINAGGTLLVAAVLGPSPSHGREQIHLEAVSANPEVARRFLADVRERMDRLNVYRGQVLSLSPGRLHMGAQTLVAFHDLPEISREDLVLPDDVLERIERHTVVFSRHAAKLVAAGRSLKRGMLLFGLPGTGKTLSLMYLIGQMPDRTVLLVSGGGMGLLQPAMQMARSLAPAMVVLEDVDLIAEERGSPFRPSGGLLFELLNELDGLSGDIDVIFALTTNRPEVLEPALAARPGRVDLAVEFPLPDLEARRKLLDLYARGLPLAVVDFDSVARDIEGASPAYIRELLRRAAVIAAEAGPLEVTQEHLLQALDELASGGMLGRKMLGYQTDDNQVSAPDPYPGFPARFMPGQ